MTEDPKGKPPARHPKWRLALLLFLLVAACWVAWQYFRPQRKLTRLTEWAVEKAMPGTKVDFSRVRVRGIETLHIKDVTVRSKDGTGILFQAKGIIITASPLDLAQKRVRKLEVKEVTVNIAKDFRDRMKEESTAGPAGNTSAWKVDRLICNYGLLNVTTPNELPLHLSTKFALDLKDVNFGEAGMKVLHQATLWDCEAATGEDPPFLQLNLVKTDFSFAALKEQRLPKLNITGGTFLVGNSLRKLMDASQANPEKEGDAWKLEELSIEGVNARLSDLGAGLPDIEFALQTKLYNLSASSVAEELGTAMQRVEISDLTVYSPLDPFVKVITLRTVFVRFSLRELLKDRIINEVTILTPTIYLCEDLFWYMDSQQRKQAIPSTAENEQTSWMIGSLHVGFGRLVLAIGGSREIGLPWTFQTDAKKVSLSNLASLHLKTDLDVPQQSYAFPDYQIDIDKLSGKILLAYPPTSGKSNLVPDIRLQKARWRQYESSDVWLSVTFDKTGVNGDFGGKAYGGDLGGGFSFFFKQQSPWIGWVYGNKIDLKKLTDIIAPQNFQMTGPVDFKMQVDAEKKLIRRVKGDFQMTKSGQVKISKIDDLLKNIPTQWTKIKKGSMRIMLETLRDFDYTKGGGDLWFVDSQGILKLNLSGPLGTRNFNIVLHEEDSAGRWQEKTKKSR